VADHSLAETVDWLAEQGIAVTASSLSQFLACHRLTEQLERNALAIETMLANELKSGRPFTSERIWEIGQKFFSHMALANQDSRVWFQAQQTELKKNRLLLDWQKHRDQLEIRKAAIQQTLNAARATGGIAPETLQQIERDLNLM
jgi:uncharacterized protein (DUF2252 family)